jgi:hypothetical protein
MFKVPIHFPRSALRRFPMQSPNVNAYHSCQAEIKMVQFSDWDLWTYCGGAGTSHAMLCVFDYFQILPYTTLEFDIYPFLNPPVVPDTPYLCNLRSPALSATAEAFRDAMIAQVNAYAARFGNIFPDMASLKAIPWLQPNPTLPWQGLKFLMPWGMLGSMAGNFIWNGPVEHVSSGLLGVDNPLIYGIRGKSRHIFGARYPYRDDYYGSYYYAPEPPPREPPRSPSFAAKPSSSQRALVIRA